ncbi:MAG: nuclear transport factor 2 family protein [Rhodobacteraceae bacterium]|nr:nuclear transport factor 2 family protein [Paracoccaceae bacterium]
MNKNLEAVRAHYAASDAMDMAAMLAPVTAQSTWTEMAGFPYAGTYTGPDALLNGVFARIGADWDGFGFKLDRLVDGGDTIVAIGTYWGTCRRTSRKMQARAVHVWEMAEGKLLRFEQFADTKLVADAMA